MDQQRYRVGPAGLILLAAVVLATGGLVLWVKSRPEQGQTLLRIRQTGIVRIGYANEDPYGYFDSATGKITGEAPEIARVILHRLGATQIEPVVTEFGSLIPGLKAGRFDVIAAGMFITSERAKEIGFSNPTYAIGEAFLVARGNPRNLHSFEDVAADEAARIGVMGGSVEHKYCKLLGISPDQVVVFPDYAAAVEGLKTGRVDAVAATLLTANELLNKAGSDLIERAEPFADPVIDGQVVKSYGAFGFRKEDTALREAFNQQLAEFIGTSEHLDLVRPFGFDEKRLPGDMTAKEVIEGP